MRVVHNLSLDLQKKEFPVRIQVKQGDTFSRAVEICLFSHGEAWSIPERVIPLIRWSVSDPDTGETASGIYDSLPDGNYAWSYEENQLIIELVPQMFSLPGLVRCDVVLVQGEKTLATFDFEFYVNRVPVDGTSPVPQSWYKLASLDQINEAIFTLQEWQMALRTQIEHVEEKIDSMKQINEAILALQEWQMALRVQIEHLEEEMSELKQIVNEM